MLRILTGRAGSGKTTEIFRRMAAEGQQRKQILLVPEQASFETEQRFCRENGNRAGVYGEVLSFTRLENRVLTLAGGVAQPMLDEGGRLLTMYAGPGGGGDGGSGRAKAPRPGPHLRGL